MADQARNGREIIQSWIKRFFLYALLLTAAAYLIDFVALRIRIAMNAHPYGTVTVRPVLAVPHKNHSTEYMVEAPQDQTCVHSLFPHSGDPPCWYLSRHPEQQINL